MQDPDDRSALRRPRRFSSGDPEVDERLRTMVAGMNPADAELVYETLATSLRLARDDISRLDRKIVNTALKEMRYAFRVFAPYRTVRKVTMFGSARTHKGDPEYSAARDFSEAIADKGWMVVTGAGPGIMEAGQEGAGGHRSFGMNIRLPFEAKPNPFIADDPKLINFKYFFTRKLMFIKEGDAFVLLPGGFGTLDEAFELLTLIQTGKSDLHPIVLLDARGGTYWQRFADYVRAELVTRRYINAEDMSLFHVCDDPLDAMEEIERFYRVYHSQRYVGGRLVLRLNAMPDAATLSTLSEEFADIVAGSIASIPASAAEVREDDFPDLPRIGLSFDRLHAGRLRMLIDRLNAIPFPG